MNLGSSQFRHGRHLSWYITVMLFIIFFINFAVENVYARRYFLIERPKLGLGLSYEFESEKREGPVISTDDTIHTFREYLDIETRGWIYHPALLMYTIRLKPEWEQRIQQLRTWDDTRRGFLQGYFIDLALLQYKPYTLNLFATRNRSVLRSSFSGRSETYGDTYGATLILKYRMFPTTLGYVHTSRTQTGFFRSKDEWDDLRLHMRHSRESNDTVLTAAYADKKRTQNKSTTETKVLRGNLTNSYDITGDRRIALGSSLSYRWSEGINTDTVGYGISESLNWKHRKNLSTNYRISYDKERREEFNTERKFIGTGLTYQVYSDLTASISGSGSLNDFTGGRENFYDGRVNLNYSRRIPWGMLNMDTRHGYRITEWDSSGSYIQVIDELHTLTTGVVTLLDNKDVDPDSIRVTDITGATVYTKDIDYRITEIDSYVRISRTTFGFIKDGQEALVSYMYFSDPAYDYSTFDQSYGINLYLWSVLKLYYRYNLSKDKFISGIPPEELKEVSAEVRGADLSYEWRWTRTRLTYEDRDSTEVPLIRFSAAETITMRLSRRLFLNLSGSFAQIKFKDSGLTERYYGLKSNLQVLTTRWSRLKLEGFWDNVSGGTVRTASMGVSSVFEWSYAIWKGNIEYRFLDETDKMINDRRKNHYLLFEIKRALW